MTTWKNAPKGKILKTDVSVAKNYLGLPIFVMFVMAPASSLEKIMTTKELSEKELEIYRQVFSLHGTMDEKTEKLKVSGTFDKY